MNQQQAETAVTASALVVGGIYVYRRLSETDVQLTNAHGLRLKQLAGNGPVMPAGPFIVGWGFTFLVISIMAQASPSLGGNFAILVAAGAVLGNGVAVSKDLQKRLGAGQTAKGGAQSGPTTGTSPAPSNPQLIPHLYPVPQGVPQPQ